MLLDLPTNTRLIRKGLIRKKRVQGVYPRVEHLKGASLVKSLALPANIRLGWKGLSGTNTLAYYQNP
jgi:hypothetical protein